VLCRWMKFLQKITKSYKNTLFKLPKHLSISLATEKPHLLTKICTRIYTETATDTRFLIIWPTLQISWNFIIINYICIFIRQKRQHSINRKLNNDCENETQKKHVMTMILHTSSNEL